MVRQVMRNEVTRINFLKTVFVLFSVSLVDIYLIMGILAKYWMFNLNDFFGACLYALPIGLFSSLSLLLNFKYKFFVAFLSSIVISSCIFIPLAIGASC